MAFYSNTQTVETKPRKITIEIIDTQLKKFKVKEISWITVTEIKKKIEKTWGIPMNQQRLFVQTQELTKNNSLLLSYASRNKCVIHIRPPPVLENNLGVIKRYESLPISNDVIHLVQEVQKGFNIGLIPKLTLNGTSGSYTLQNRNRKAKCIFKPFDEEPFTPNNPRGYTGKLGSPGFRQGILSGESATREVAAFLLDEDEYYGVPPTTFVELVHPYFANRDLKEINVEDEKDMNPVKAPLDITDGAKRLTIKHGSLQMFIEDTEEAGNFGYKMFPDEEVRKIAILDIRILNCDRNEGNILVKKVNGKFVLIPIDHGLALPDCFNICSYEIVWMDWPQVKKPFTEAEMIHINKFNPKADVIKLSEFLKFREVCLRNFRMAETILKNGAQKGLTLYEIGTIIYKDDPDQISPIEEILERTEQIYKITKSSATKNIVWGHKKLNGTVSTGNGKLIVANTMNNLDQEKENSNKEEEKSITPIHYPLPHGRFDSPGKRDRTMSEHYYTDYSYSPSPYIHTLKSSLTPVLENSRFLEVEKDMIPARPSYTKHQSANMRVSVKSNKTNDSKRDSDYPSREISEESNDEDDGNEIADMGTKKKRKSSSIPANMKITRVHSLPGMLTKQLSKQESPTRKESDNTDSISSKPEPANNKLEKKSEEI